MFDETESFKSSHERKIISLVDKKRKTLKIPNSIIKILPYLKISSIKLVQYGESLPQIMNSIQKKLRSWKIRSLREE